MAAVWSCAWMSRRISAAIVNPFSVSIRCRCLFTCWPPSKFEDAMTTVLILRPKSFTRASVESAIDLA